MNLRNYLGAECRTAREEMGDESEEFLQVPWAGRAGEGRGEGVGRRWWAWLMRQAGAETKVVLGQDLKQKAGAKMVKARE